MCVCHSNADAQEVGVNFGIQRSLMDSERVAGETLDWLSPQLHTCHASLISFCAVAGKVMGG